MVLLLSCSSSKITNTSVTVEPAPDGFSNPNMVLLIQKKVTGIGHNKKNRNINYSFKKYYSGKFEMVSSEEICINTKYKDNKTYRYIFHDEIIEGPPGAALNYTINYHLYDRITDKKINVDVECSLSAEANDAIAKKLNKYLTERKSGIVSAHQ